jgi:hypothetical protein
MTTVLRVSGAIAFFSFASLAARQQPAQQATPPPTGLVLGRAVDVGTGRGIASAIVSISPAGGAPAIGSPGADASLMRFPIRVVSDGEGRFLFHGLPKGNYSLTATKAGYGDTTFGRQSPLDTTNGLLQLADGERKGDVTLVMWKLASISGTVVDEAGEPVVGLPIRVMHRTIIGGRPRFTDAGNQPFTDDRGMFRARSLPPGDYVVAIITTETTVSIPWQSAAFSAFRSDSVAANREFARSAISMSAALTFGQRVGSLSVSSGGLGLSVAAPVVGDKVFVYPTTFYPAAAMPSKATTITLGSGEERTGVDLQVRPMATARVSGSISGPDGPEGGVGFELINATTDEVDRDPVFAVATGVSDASGAFTMLGVPAGNYLLRVQQNPPQPESRGGTTTVIQAGSMTISTGTGGTQPPVTDDPTLWATAPVSVTGPDVTGLGIVLRPGVRLSGRVQFAGSRPQPTAAQLTEMNVSVQAAGGRTQAALTINGGAFYSTRGSVDANGQFKTYQFPPGRYVVRVTSPPPGWTFAGATFRGHDIADGPLEVNGEDLREIVLTMTDKPAELSGTVHGSQGPDAAASVLVFPADPTAWLDYGPTARRLRLMRPSSDGSYRTTLPTGDYLVVAIHSPVPSTWLEPDFLRRLTTLATRVTIADGDKKVQDLRSTEVR